MKRFFSLPVINTVLMMTFASACIWVSNYLLKATTAFFAGILIVMVSGVFGFTAGYFLKKQLSDFYKDWRPDSYCKYDIHYDREITRGILWCSFGLWIPILLVSGPIIGWLPGLLLAILIGFMASLAELALFLCGCKYYKKFRTKTLTAQTRN